MNANTAAIREFGFVTYSSIPRDSNGRLTGVSSGIPGSLKRITKTEFHNPATDSASADYVDPDNYHLSSNKRLLRLASSVEVQSYNY